MSQTLSNIREDMTILDTAGEEVGKVKFVHYGDEDPNRPGPEAATPSVEDHGEDTLLEEIADVFTDVDIPKEIQDRMHLNGFIRVDMGLLQADGYVMMDQIKAVSGDKVHINISKDNVYQP